MAQQELTTEFRGLQRGIALGTRRLVVIAAHTEVREVLAASERLAAMRLRAQLVGSYARRVAIWPGKDVDIFGLVEAPDTTNPGVLHAAFGQALTGYEQQGRLRAQPRSWLIDFGPDRLPSRTAIRKAAAEHGWDDNRVDAVVAATTGGSLLPFTVDVVPARPAGNHFEIPQIDIVRRADGRPEITADGRIAKRMTGDWVLTNPLALNDLTTELNGDLVVGGQGAFVPLVKHVRQIRGAHLDGIKPSSLFYEFALHAGVNDGEIAGESWADLTASATAYVHRRLTGLANDPVVDPILGTPYLPAPPADDLATAVDAWRDVTRRANRAVLATERCSAALAWQGVFGVNGRSDPLPVFPTPPGCTGTGGTYGVADAGVAANAARGGDEERGFGAV